jgi:hypothetical protein
MGLSRNRANQAQPRHLASFLRKLLILRASLLAYQTNPL